MCGVGVVKVHVWCEGSEGVWMWVWLQRLLTVYVPPPPVVSFAPLLLVFFSLSPSPLEASLAEQLLPLVFYALSPAKNIQCTAWFRLSECHRVHCSTGQSKQTWDTLGETHYKAHDL